ncbi:MAG: CRISPR system precrRNA processing endoribonuclease RAMP protein Cas6 [Epsilonproteobacteria bacterium]|nr:CRISPR system precrRNA processing endoribonuclease RAMP protein Cas6 [Campylobacterota bacterium]
MQYLKFYIESNIKALPFIGSMIRGALGSSLKSVVCINPSYECQTCFASNNCLYYEFYEEKNRFLNYRLDFRLNQKNIEFKYILFNEAISKYPYIISAIEKMFTQKGVGKDRVTTDNFKIFYEDKIIYENGKFNNIKITPKEFVETKKAPSIVKLNLVTPLRLKRDGRFLKPDTLDIKDILLSIIGKKAFFEKASKEHIEQFPTVAMKNLNFIDFSRYSNRQKKKLKIGGIIGEMVINNLTPQTYNLLRYGEISGVGKLNSFGLGKIELENLE